MSADRPVPQPTPIRPADVQPGGLLWPGCALCGRQLRHEPPAAPQAWPACVWRPVRSVIGFELLRGDVVDREFERMGTRDVRLHRGGRRRFPSRSLIAAIKARLPVEVVASALMPDLAGAGRTMKARCCFHEDSRPSFVVWPEIAGFRCYGCGVHGDVLTLIELAERRGLRWN